MEEIIPIDLFIPEKTKLAAGIYMVFVIYFEMHDHIYNTYKYISYYNAYCIYFSDNSFAK